VNQELLVGKGRQRREKFVKEEKEVGMRGRKRCVREREVEGLCGIGKTCKGRGSFTREGKSCEERGRVVRVGKTCEGRGSFTREGKSCEERARVVRKGMCFVGRGRVGEGVEELQGKGKDCDEERV
jgi:stalled ribosome alternative rescue factor ArfA